MAMPPVDAESSTVAITSVIVAVVTYGFSAAMELKPGILLAIAAGMGIVSYGFGVVLIGLLAVVGFTMVVAIIWKSFVSDSSQG